MANVQNTSKLRRVKLFSAAPVFVAVLSSIAAFADEEVVSTTGKLIFGGAESGFACRGLEFSRCEFDREKEKFVCAGKDAPGLWKLVFRAGPTGAEKVLEAGRCGTATCVHAAGGCRFVWKRLDIDAGDAAVDVMADVAWSERTQGFEFRISVVNRSAKYGLWSTEYPRLGSIISPGTGWAVLPGGNWGMKRLRELKEAQAPLYPSFSAPMQLAAFDSDSGYGASVAALDGDAWLKYFRTDTNFTFSVETPAPDAGLPGAHGTPPFAVALSAYKGDWWVAAKRYREWAKGAKWLSKGPISERRDFPAKMRDAGLWLCLQGDGKTIGHAVEATLARLKGCVPLAFQWYGWYCHPHDIDYPEYFPEKPGVADVAKRLVAKGVLVTPYVNARLWAQGIPSFPSVKQYACAQPDGSVYTEEYGSGCKFAPMCQSTACWQNKMLELTTRMVEEVGVNALYIDQIASMTPVLCHALNHGHTPGGGSYWVDGYRKMLADISARLPDTVLTSENAAEPYIDYVDGFLNWCPNTPEDVAALPAVYSGYAAYYASVSEPQDDLLSFRMLQGRSFLWGCQVGWMDASWLLDGAHRAHFEFIANLAALHNRHNDFFADGELIGEVPNRADASTVKSVWHRNNGKTAELPAVQATLWRDRSGNELLAVVNYSNVKRRFDAGRSDASSFDLVPGEVRCVPLRPADTWIPREKGLYRCQVHRSGGAHTRPECALESMLWTWGHGCTPEADARLTKDGVAIAFHDDTLGRLGRGVPEAKRKMRVADLNWDELRNVDLGSYLDCRYSDYRISTMVSVFAAMVGRKDRLLYLDEKGAPPKMMAKMSAALHVQDQVYYCSCDWRKVVEWKKFAPKGRSMVWLHGGWPQQVKPDIVTYVERNLDKAIGEMEAFGFKGIDQIQIHVRTDLSLPDPFCPSSAYLRKAIERLHRRGVYVQALSWDAGDNPETYRKLWILGFDHFATDYPETLFKVLPELAGVK